MNFRKKFIVMILLVALLAMSLFIFPAHSHSVHIYDLWFYYPFQSVREFFFGLLPFSIGDIAYVVAGICLLVTVARWIYYLIKFKAHKLQLAASVINVANAAIFTYLFFIVGWGANYYKPGLRESWDLGMPADTTANGRKLMRIKDSSATVAFDKILIEQLNIYAPHFHSLSFSEINNRSQHYYSAYTDSKVKRLGLNIKPTMFGYFLERLAVEGYYNPFTGEGQIDKGLPSFLIPFVVCHEMAHQAGIAAEDDANLMAYALGTTTDDSTFRYSAYLNIWVYAHNRVYRRDSALAIMLEKQINKLTTAHIDTMEQLSKKYDNGAARYSTDLYDNYLKMQNQKQGIRSYGNVVSSAWQLELQRKKQRKALINIP